MPRQVDFTCKRIQTSISLNKGVITNENTRERPRLKFMINVRLEPWKHRQPKTLKKMKIRFLVKQFLKRCKKLQRRDGSSTYKECSSINNIKLVLNG